MEDDGHAERGSWAPARQARHRGRAAGLAGRRRRGQPQCFAGVKLKEVDGLAHICVGLGPVFAHLISEPGAELEVPASDDLCGAEQKRGPRFH